MKKNHLHFGALKPFKALVAGTALLILVACSGNPSFVSDTPGRVTSGGPARMPDNVLSALCEGRASDAITLLTAEPLGSPADKFFAALSLEEAGHPARARSLYVSVMRSGTTDSVKIRCGGTTLANGTILDEAARRLALISQNLALLDTDLRPHRHLHAGLPPSTKPTRSKSAPSYSGPRMTVSAPSGQSPFGQWFVHLASYSSIESAAKNKGTLEKKFPALQGIIDQWEINAQGNTAIRLGIRVQAKGDAQQLCNAVQSQGSYCAVIDTSS